MLCAQEWYLAHKQGDASAEDADLVTRQSIIIGGTENQQGDRKVDEMEANWYAVARSLLASVSDCPIKEELYARVTLHEHAITWVGDAKLSDCLRRFAILSCSNQVEFFRILVDHLTPKTAKEVQTFLRPVALDAENLPSLEWRECKRIMLMIYRWEL